MLALKNVSKTYKNGVLALKNIDLAIGKDEIVAVVGPSGCGKTTILKIAAGLIKPTSGSVSLSGHSVSVVFQDHVLLPWRTVRENVSLPIELGRGKSKDVDRMIRMVHLSKFSSRYPHELSGGMKQRVAIARALVANEDILLMDEPFGSLDEIARDKLNRELLEIKNRLGFSVLFITHSVHEAVYVANRVVVMSKRPGMVKDIIEVNIPKKSPDMKNTREFQEIVDKVRRALK